MPGAEAERGWEPRLVAEAGRGWEPRLDEAESRGWTRPGAEARRGWSRGWTRLGEQTRRGWEPRLDKTGSRRWTRLGAEAGRGWEPRLDEAGSRGGQDWEAKLYSTESSLEAGAEAYVRGAWPLSSCQGAVQRAQCRGRSAERQEPRLDSTARQWRESLGNAVWHKNVRLRQKWEQLHINDSAP